MSTPPIPLVFDPLFKPKPWGGRRLATLLDKRLPPHELIGESWELVSLPGNESRVRDGPLAGRTLAELVKLWGQDLLGEAKLVDGRFPLLIKFLDARENLSVQVHPKPAADDPSGARPGIKHEAWYVIHADPGAKLYIGIQPGVTPADVARVVNTPAMMRVMRAWDAAPGQCYYLPSGTLHALGAGVVVAEIQTPSDITYRAYDWDRVGPDGRGRELHIKQALANIRYDIAAGTIRQTPLPVVASEGIVTRVIRCERFLVNLVQRHGGLETPLLPGSMRAWLILAGAGRLRQTGDECRFASGDVVLIPANASGVRVELATDSRWLEITVPAGV